ncbi:ABC transporter ATP-binding protein NatA [Neolewinella maritima]|uniref:ABC transporter ATP-binding protein NatA n=1 Tax=Neolewinella maritima TaxID=1383882 RepID=A0ABN8F7H8_9BACT|nr:ABC transporter ATP-binding protein [Neolewinella maritima]CAH1000131.1 ABC transporter ATP-binding protein NatA [Neolewinella maritima]
MGAEAARIDVQLDNVSKRFGREWVIKQLSVHYSSGSIYGIQGRNGSGKSTLLRMLAGQLSPSRGQVSYTVDGQSIGVRDVYRLVSWTGPYLEIIEELTVAESLAFHFGLKPLLAELTIEGVLDRIELRDYRMRSLQDCSSGMRQRVLLATALYADTPMLLLDEPTVTLDAAAAKWFAGELKRYAPGRLTVVASNDPRDLASCTTVLTL